ncbi:hypothetical protein DNFV4_03988 [Nitrospira tepida]|uniref:Uncharacterized protein n=1 Tax=Nitrospira tepida TaxID=2973512 RepID=A0AA86N2N3_9BACT|nr:hypothetical protein DNFV4_03988 [Nitrospira tepida]
MVSGTRIDLFEAQHRFEHKTTLDLPGTETWTLIILRGLRLRRRHRLMRRAKKGAYALRKKQSPQFCIFLPNWLFLPYG